MTQIKIIKKTDDTLTLEIDPLVFDDTDAADDNELYNVEINFADDDFDCEHDDCVESSLPSISFLDMSPVQSIMTNCLSHQPQALRDFIAAL
jgi:hypothetical protein